MTDTTDHAGTDPNADIEAQAADPRSDLEQAVESRSDAVERGEGGEEPATMTNSGLYSGVAGTGGEVTNDGYDEQ